MRKLKSLLLCSLLFIMACSSQKNVSQGPVFTGAEATKLNYQAVYQLNTDDAKAISGVLRNISNALEDERLKNKLQIELVVHGNGVVAFMKDHPYKDELLKLKEKGVILAECLNTMREKNISKDQLFDFISYVPSGNGEIIIRQQQGWAYIHP